MGGGGDAARSSAQSLAQVGPSTVVSIISPFHPKNIVHHVQRPLRTRKGRRDQGASGHKEKANSGKERCTHRRTIM